MLSRYFRGKNFMTPEIIEYGNAKDNLVYEFSSGRGLFGGTIWGVTVVEKNDIYSPVSELSRCFDRYDKADKYIKALKKWGRSA